VTAYVLKRPDATWSVLVVNKDASPRRVSIDFGNGMEFNGTVHVATFGAEQYAWSGGGPADPPSRDKGVQRRTVGAGGSYTVAPLSITVFRGTIARREVRSTRR
jgi:hypothetical protein